MRFEYTSYGSSRMPLIPIVFAHGKNHLPPMGALVDTGATHTILPMEMAKELGISVALTDQIESQVAGGGQCYVYVSPVPLTYILRSSAGDEEFRWSGKVLFALGQQFALLGHHQCLQKFDILFQGPEKSLDISARFKRSVVQKRQ